MTDTADTRLKPAPDDYPMKVNVFMDVSPDGSFKMHADNTGIPWALVEWFSGDSKRAYQMIELCKDKDIEQVEVTVSGGHKFILRFVT